MRIVFGVKENLNSKALKILKLIVTLCLFYFWTSTNLFAAHIIGGVITYECLGGDNYKFTMKIYRDCLGGGAEFDSFGSLIGTVSIFRGNSNQEYKKVLLNPPAITNIQPNISNPCLQVPSGICVEEGVYTFTVNLPKSTDSYHIAYQRCCRNNTIINLAAPGDSGATYYIELTPEAQNACNNSPVFDNFPPIVICAGEEIQFDHSATDAEGDQLQYSLCQPFLGGGTNMTVPNAPNGVAPDPDLPPPYFGVNYVVPYGYNNPLGSAPPNTLNIHPTTGFLNGIPNVVGQFVVGVCVEEFRNGVLLSRVFRDFQFNVTTCDPTVVADIAEDSIVMQMADEIYYVKACGPDGVFFENESFQLSNIESFKWVFDIGATPLVIEGPGQANWSPTIDFPGLGIYNGQLILNPGFQCNDTADIIVEVFPEVHPNFEFDYDTCIANPVVFTDLSFSDAGPNTIIDWRWAFGDGQGSDEVNPIYEYQMPGSMPVTLTVTDINDCEDQIVRTVDYFPVPEILVIAPSEFVGCNPADIFFENLSIPIDESYDIIWDFGDGETGTGVSPTHTYDETGVFTVSVDVTSPIGCQTDTTWKNLITILGSPRARFDYTPDQPSNIEPTVHFLDESEDAIQWRWDFSGLDVSLQRNPVFTFPDTGLQVIELVVTHQSGCRDTTLELIDVIPEVRYFLPNAFTPNGDGKNDLFKGQGKMVGATNFRMTIWNRYGEMLFETTDPFEGWNGKKNNSGKLAQQGVYLVQVTYTGPRGERVEVKGYATLII